MQHDSKKKLKTMLGPCLDPKETLLGQLSGGTMASQRRFEVRLLPWVDALLLCSPDAEELVSGNAIGQEILLK